MDFIQLSNSNKGGGKIVSREITGIGNNITIKEMGVKVVKASQLGTISSTSNPFVILEIDEPSQRFQTNTSKGPNCVWEQTFSV